MSNFSNKTCQRTNVRWVPWLGFGLAVLLAPGTGVAQEATPALAADECTNAANVPSGLQPTTPSSDFVIVGAVNDGIVRHVPTGLEWRRCPLGSTFSDGACTGIASVNWQTALQNAHEEGGGWRVPNVNELTSIVEECRGGPAVNRVVFPGIGVASAVWTSTTHNDPGLGPTFALTVDFSSGHDMPRLKTNSTLVMLVRDSL